MKYDNAHRQVSAVLAILNQAAMDGDTYLPLEVLMSRCLRTKGRPVAAQIDREINRLLSKGFVVAEGDRLYLKTNHRYEVATAEQLGKRMMDNDVAVPPEQLDAALAAAEAFLPAPLDDSQRKAVARCLTHRITAVTGGAGSGKTTMIRALHLANAVLNPKRQAILCAPTGRAARNMAVKADHTAHTVHRVLGKTPDSDFLDALDPKCLWAAANLVIVDEASMVTLEMMAGLLDQAAPDCHIVLVGDPNQLPSVGPGDVLPALLDLGVPHAHLQGNHRQDREASALLHNVQEFAAPGSVNLDFDASFQLIRAYTDTQAQREIVSIYGPMAAAGEEVQVLSPFRTSTLASAHALNQTLQQIINPPACDKPEQMLKPLIFRDGDKVLLAKNTRQRCNGDIGVMTVYRAFGDVAVSFDGTTIPFSAQELCWFDLAYALTIHKAQGCEYDTVIVPVLRDFSIMLTRNLFYTAISRARRKLILVGDEDAVHKALATLPRPRYSTLAARAKNQERRHVS